MTEERSDNTVPEKSTALETGGAPADPPPPTGEPGEAKISDSDAKTWCLLAHLSPFCGVIIPLGGILGPLILWLVKKDDHPAIDYHGKEALNFNICFMIYLLVAAFSMIAFVGIILLPAVGITWLVLVIMAAIKVSNGEPWRYPMIFRLVN